MDLYIATSPSYLFTALCLKCNENVGSEGDLILVDVFPNAVTYASRLETLGFFHRIIVVPGPAFKKWGAIFKEAHSKIGYMFLLFRELVLRVCPGIGCLQYRGYPFSRQRYARTFMPGIMRAFLWLHLYQRKKYRCKTYLFDSGIGTRIQRPAAPRFLHDRIMRFLGAKYMEDYIEGRYYYDTAGVVSQYGKPIRQILPSTQNEVLSAAVRYCFNYTPESDKLFEHDYIFMQQCFDAYESMQPLVAKQRNIWEYIASRIPAAVVRPHPRTKEQYDPVRTIAYDCGLSFFDVSCMFCEDMDEKVLFTCFSNALLVPKHMFGKEPYLVFLYKLLGTSDFSGISMETWDDLIQNSVIASYSDPEKVKIPASFEELGVCLDEIIAKKTSSAR